MAGLPGARISESAMRICGRYLDYLRTALTCDYLDTPAREIAVL